MSFLGCALGLAQAVAEQQAEREYFLSMSPEQLSAYISAKLKQAEADKEERRHQEICAAIRSTSFWKLGS